MNDIKNIPEHLETLSKALTLSMIAVEDTLESNEIAINMHLSISHNEIEMLLTDMQDAIDFITERL